MIARAVLAAVLTCTLAGVAVASAPDFAAMDIITYDVPRPAPELGLPDLDGKTARLEDFRGKVLLVVFWATWCPDCRKDVPAIAKLYTELKRRGLEVVLVDFRESADLVRRTVRERGYTARVLLDESGDTTGRAWGVFGTPSVYIVDRQGRLVGRAVGARDWDSAAARRMLAALLDSR